MSGDPERRRKLQRLIADQSKDDQTWRLLDERFGRKRGRVFKATDLGPNDEGWAYLADAIDERPPAHLIGTTLIWGADVTSYHPRRMVCPACGDWLGDPSRRDDGAFCLVCSASSGTPKQWPANVMVRPRTRLSRPKGVQRPKRGRGAGDGEGAGELKGGL